jgi:dienelactone hydrolase
MMAIRPRIGDRIPEPVRTDDRSWGERCEARLADLPPPRAERGPVSLVGAIGGGGTRSAPRVLAIIGLALMTLAQPHPEAAGQVVAFRLADGRMLSGLWMEAQNRPAPAVVLVPMLGRSHDEWQATAQRLSDVNINALAIDLPGTALPASPAELSRWHQAVRAAVAYLVSQPADVRAAAIGLLGASLGANLALVDAAEDMGVASLALVSPSLDYRGVRIDSLMANYGSRPALLIASVHDPYAARSVRALAQDTSGAREVRWSNVPAHGTVLLSRDPELATAIVEWFQRTLGVH